MSDHPDGGPCICTGECLHDLKAEIDALTKRLRELEIFVGAHIHDVDSRGRLDRHHHQTHRPNGGGRYFSHERRY